MTDHYRETVYFAMFQQVPLVLLCTLLLDGGRMVRACGVSVLGFWATAGLLMARRPTSPRPGDLAFLRRRILPQFALIALLV